MNCRPRIVRADEDQTRLREPGTLRHYGGQGVRRLDGQHAGAGQAPRKESRSRRRALGHRLVRGAHADIVRRRARASHTAPRWTAGAATSTTGPSATPSASTCSIARRTPGARSSSGAERDEFQKRAAFALLASLALHDKSAGRAVRREPGAHRARGCRRAQLRQERRQLGAPRVGRRNAALNAKAVTLARRLSESPEAAARWIGKESLKELTSPAVTRQLARKTRASPGVVGGG